MALSMRLASPSACVALLSSSSSNAPVSSHPKLSLGKSSFHGIRLLAVPKLRPSFAASSAAGTVKMMAKREEELKEIREMSTDDINEQVVDLKGELLMLRLQKSARNEFKPSEFGRMRKRIARMLTVKREREIDEGITKRLSRKLDRKWKKSIVVRPPPSLKKIQEEKAAEAQSS